MQSDEQAQNEMMPSDVSAAPDEPEAQPPAVAEEAQEVETGAVKAAKGLVNNNRFNQSF